MFEQDYIMRIIKSMIAALLKLLFDIDTDSPAAELIEDYDARNNLITLTDMIDDGNINHAENELYRLLSEDTLDLKAGILFYSHLNDKDDDFLEQHNYTREEIELGIRLLADKYGCADILTMF